MRHGRPSRPPCSASTQAKRARSSSIPNKEQALSSIPYKGALVVGTGPGISASLARQLSHAGLKVAVAARNIDKLQHLAAETGAQAFAVDATDPTGVADLFAAVEAGIGVPEVVVYNASGRVRGPIVDLDPEEVRREIGRAHV